MSHLTSSPERAGPLPAVLSIETCGEVCGIALLVGSRLMAEWVFRHEMHLSERIMGFVDLVLRQGGVEPENLSALAVDTGPGSFTGLRIGIMTAKALADCLSIPVYGVESLEALAWSSAIPDGESVITMLPCRANVVYAAIYRQHAGRPVCVVEPTVCAAGDLAAMTASAECRTPQWASGSGFYRFGGTARESECLSGMTHCGEDWPRAVTVARIADTLMLNGEPGSTGSDLAPSYRAEPSTTRPKTAFHPQVSQDPPVSPV